MFVYGRRGALALTLTSPLFNAVCGSPSCSHAAVPGARTSKFSCVDLRQSLSSTGVHIEIRVCTPECSWDRLFSFLLMRPPNRTCGGDSRLGSGGQGVQGSKEGSRAQKGKEGCQRGRQSAWGSTQPPARLLSCCCCFSQFRWPAATAISQRQHGMAAWIARSWNGFGSRTRSRTGSKSQKHPRTLQTSRRSTPRFPWRRFAGCFCALSLCALSTRMLFTCTPWRCKGPQLAAARASEICVLICNGGVTMQVNTERWSASTDQMA